MFTHRRHGILIGGLAVLAALFAVARPMAGGAQTESASRQPAANDKIDFVRDIRPLFVDRCLKCHGPQKQESGFRLDRRRDAFAGGDTGTAIVPGKSGEGLLVRYIAGTDPLIVMPPEGKPLTKAEVALVRAWIDHGALWPKEADLTAPGPAETHWAFQPIARPAVPTFQKSGDTGKFGLSPADWVRSPIDAFVLSRLNEREIAPSAAANRHTLIRRLSLDLLGLPPTPEEVDEFVRDDSPDAYEKLVDRLLQSPHFGERWGRHWLDKARYADSDGYEKDRPRPNAWRYRNWVIDAVNRDVPFDRFTIEQLAGDLLTEAGEMQKLATAFHRQTLTNTEGGTDQEQFRVEAIFDRVDTTGTVWLGLTVGCARCHSHKYDPIAQREYYRLFAFFNNGDEAGTNITISQEALARYEAEKPKFDQAVKNLEQALRAAKDNLGPALAKWERSRPEKLPQNIAAILAVAPEKRDAKQKQTLLDYYAGIDPTVSKFSKELDDLKKRAPKSPYLPVRVIAQRTGNPRKTHVLRRGDFLQPADEVQPGVLEVLHSFEPRKKDAPADRLDLARWLMSPDNPLTPRVAVNDIWAHLFGRPLVATMNDFGLRGEQPTHPALLDWLASEYIRLGWSRKAMIKTIVMSAAYRQSSVHRLELADVDPQNDLLYRQNRFRVEAETVRDLTLAAAGLLSPKIGGPSVFPPLPPDVAALSYANNFKWNTSQGEDRYRRGMYTFFKRTAPHPNLMTFDCPDANTTAVNRQSSNTPLQALVTMNNEVFVEASQAMGRRLFSARAAGDAARLAYGFRICVSRPPSDFELERFRGLLEASRHWYSTHAADAKKLIGNYAVDGVPAEENAAWIATARVMLNLDEFITRE